ncbi:hypothetical protein RIF29_12615 [Crotalaria pallida]|uniref:Uncharacterized protein n=1 Tax=Crotalaria pallida TaxID=3830 RepID=A0AAN9INE1_CROPI
MEFSSKYNNIRSYAIANNNNDVYYNQQKVINVPFSWEYEPGLSKFTPHPLSKNDTKHCNNVVLQPPPCSSMKTEVYNKLRVQDTESSVLPSSSSSIMRMRTTSSSFPMENLKKNEDPFMEAYKKCTTSPSSMFDRSSSKSGKNNGAWPNSIMKYLNIFSCKYSSDVMNTV